ncbi:MAG: guanylate kinase [Peptococcaceae bacterium]|jgi:guanylate kinase|nr:guanylate kinase [Peptococcaceae bacterium]
MNTNGRNEQKSLKSGLLIVISGPSGVGKGTICSELLKRDENLALSVSATTRTPGPNEVFGRNYFFYSDKEFQDIVDRDGFLEWAEVHGKRYGTLKSQMEEVMNAGKDCILEIDVQGGIQVDQKMPGSCITIFVKAPSEEELIRRITSRNREKPEEIKRRMLTARWEMTQEEKYQYTVVNDRLEEAVSQILVIIREERSLHAAAVH